MRISAVLFVALLLSGCVGNAPRRADVALYDFGSAAGPWTAPGYPVASVAVRAPSWLNSPAQLYRLAYADDLRRHSYAGSRWTAPPAELLERFLQQRVMRGQPDFAGRGCRLVLSLDELEQRFDAPQASQVVLEAGARLLPPQGDTLLAQRTFSLRAPAGSPDARGGAEATRAAAAMLTDELGRWLGEIGSSHPVVGKVCKGA